MTNDSAVRTQGRRCVSLAGHLYANALDAMTVRGLAERTKECYIEAVTRLTRHYHRSPD